MKGLGSLLFIFGVASAVFAIAGREVRLLLWINTWGPEVGWAIRVGFIVAGALLWLAGARARSKSKG
jgi:hypothetical protein